MGWSCSWAAVQGADKAQVLGRLGFVETTTEVEPGSRGAKWSLSPFAGDWLIIFSEDFDWGGPDRVLELSRFGPAVGLQFEDKVEMASIACAAKDGAEVWRVSHRNSDDDEEQLVVTGNPPAALSDIRKPLELEQQDEDGGTDYLHDIPIEVAKSVFGYRADDWEPPFVALQKVGAATEERPSGGFFKRLFGGGR
jgi:hypothetical protein